MNSSIRMGKSPPPGIPKTRMVIAKDDLRHVLLRLLGVPLPTSGVQHLLALRLLHERHPRPLTPRGQALAWCELAARLGHQITPDEGPCTVEELAELEQLRASAARWFALEARAALASTPRDQVLVALRRLSTPQVAELDRGWIRLAALQQAVPLPIEMLRTALLELEREGVLEQRTEGDRIHLRLRPPSAEAGAEA